MDFVFAGIWDYQHLVQDKEVPFLHCFACKKFRVFVFVQTHVTTTKALYKVCFEVYLRDAEA